MVEEAWLDRQGNTLAVVWSKNASAKARGVKLRAVLKKHRLSLKRANW